MTIPPHLIGTAKLVDQTTGEVLYDPDAGKAVPIADAKQSKYRNKKTEIDGRVFDSKREANHYLDLREQQRAGLITDLRCQVPIPLIVNNHCIGNYVADFQYFDAAGELVTVDVKGFRTDVYKLKRDILAANGITIREV